MMFKTCIFSKYCVLKHEVILSMNKHMYIRINKVRRNKREKKIKEESSFQLGENETGAKKEPNLIAYSDPSINFLLKVYIKLFIRAIG